MTNMKLSTCSDEFWFYYKKVGRITGGKMEYVCAQVSLLVLIKTPIHGVTRTTSSILTPNQINMNLEINITTPQLYRHPLKLQQGTKRENFDQFFLSSDIVYLKML